MGKRNKRRQRRAAKLKLKQLRKEQEEQKEKKVAGCDKTVFVPGIGTVHQTTKTLGVLKVDDWEVELDIVKECGKCSDNGESIVWVEPLAKIKIDALMSEYKSMEWLAYLLGDKEERVVKDIHIPEQSASSALVDDVNCAEFNNMPVIGVMHSHHGMGTGFSGTDHKYVNSNHDISLVVAHSGIAGQVRSKVPCGALMINDAKIKLRFSVEGFDADKFIAKVKPNIKTRVFHYTQPPQKQWQHRPVTPSPRPGEGSGYWYNGKWHRSDPIKETAAEKEIEKIHKSRTGTAAHYWNCPHCNQQNYTLNTRICWSCKKHKTPQTGAWMCNYCKGVNNRMHSATCIFCKTVRPTSKLSLSDENQKKIEEAWNQENSLITLAVEANENHECKKCSTIWTYQIGEEIYCHTCDPKEKYVKIKGDGQTEVDTRLWTTGIAQKHLGMYNCARCQGKWEDVDLRKFTACPNCDRLLSGEKTLEEELKEQFDKADAEIEKNINDLKEKTEEEKKRLNISVTDVKQNMTTTTSGQPAAGTDTHLHHCRICKKIVAQANTVHKACLPQGDYPCKFCGMPIGVPNAYHVNCFEKKQAGLKSKDDIWEFNVGEPIV
jgi:hypothetical protein